MFDTAVLLSIDVYYFYLICEGIKKVEIRKTKPSFKKFGGGGQVFMYVTKNRRSLRRIPEAKRAEYELFLGYIGGYFYCDFIDAMTPDFNPELKQFFYNDNWQNTDWNSEMYCLTREELQESARGKTLYGWHITYVDRYKTPKFLYYLFSDISITKPKTTGGMTVKATQKRIKTPPQSWRYCDEVLWVNLK